MFVEDDIRRNLISLKNYLEAYGSEATMEQIASYLKKYFTNFSLENTPKEFDKKVIDLIKFIEEPNKKCTLIILKNKRELFDMYIFEEPVEFAMLNLVSSEAFEDAIRRNPVKGFVIDDISDDNILIFLKAYYIYRKEPSQSPTALNLAPQYSFDCLEMAALEEKLNTDNLTKKELLEYVILYDKSALPYNLGYLDEYKKALSGKWNLAFADAIKKVRSDRYFGMSLKKFRG